MTTTDLETLKTIERNGVAHSVYWCHWPKMQLVEHPQAVVTESDLLSPFFNNIFSAVVPASGAESVVDDLVSRFQSRSVTSSSNCWLCEGVQLLARAESYEWSWFAPLMTTFKQA